MKVATAASVRVRPEGEGFRPRPPREGGEGGYRPRRPEGEGFRPRPPREGGDGGYRPFAVRRAKASVPARLVKVAKVATVPAVPRAKASVRAKVVKAATAPRPPPRAKAFGPREGGEGGYRPRRPEGEGFRPRPPREGGDSGFRPRRPEGEGFRPREGGEGGYRPRRPEGEGFPSASPA